MIDYVIVTLGINVVLTVISILFIASVISTVMAFVKNLSDYETAFGEVDGDYIWYTLEKAKIRIIILCVLGISIFWVYDRHSSLLPTNNLSERIGEIDMTSDIKTPEFKKVEAQSIAEEFDKAKERSREENKKAKEYFNGL